MNLEIVNNEVKQSDNKIIEKLDINLIVAVTKNMVIGINDKLPWTNLKDDMLNFKNKTTNIMRCLDYCFSSIGYIMGYSLYRLS